MNHGMPMPATLFTNARLVDLEQQALTAPTTLAVADGRATVDNKILSADERCAFSHGR